MRGLFISIILNVTMRIICPHLLPYPHVQYLAIFHSPYFYPSTDGASLRLGFSADLNSNGQT